ncbi:tRNA (cytosine(72)-C(5))-methyltransferase NSUN6-like isoform X2 [Penaeus japonicus]|uniref:tRNA (cytosine(72)-C(5))-methyltransferase NSUN6-like isoform X2 n=1 Tax=Penaeus japonicus TaxID=27405 RepID=UPI001C71014E|nr:tRNA (cytosine(72)-C(5))-methyltransferase NSUN6-like isoform X2 [Penaeus japonicus]
MPQNFTVKNEVMHAMETDTQSTLAPGTFNPLLAEVTNFLIKLRRPSEHHDEEPDKKHRCVRTFYSCQDLNLLSLPPRYTTLRVNLSRKTINEAQILVTEEMKKQFEGHSYVPAVYPHHTLCDLLVVETRGAQKVTPAKKEVVVGKMCGSAVLRGAEVYAPGVLGVMPGVLVGETVAVYVDLDDKCLRGSKGFNGRKMFIGNGIALQARKDIFTKVKPSGIAVSMKEQIFDCPSLGSFHQDFFFLQNLPSVLCSHILRPSKHAVVLDMCAAPGGKSTHIASLMNGTGSVIAIDRSQNKINQITENADRLGLKNIIAIKYDSTKLLEEEKPNVKGIIPEDTRPNENSLDCLRPPYKLASFNWILLDAPCSALGQRPQLQTKANVKEIQSFPVIQRKLLSNGIKLFALGGTLVYSTCTIVPEENEEMVKWVLDNFADIKLVDAQPKLGLPGLPNCGLNEEQCKKVQRFGPSFMVNSPLENNVDCDTIGFFIAAFSKIQI